jgi:TP901 family phage tail tape measure protein
MADKKLRLSFSINGSETLSVALRKVKQAVDETDAASKGFTARLGSSWKQTATAISTTYLAAQQFANLLQNTVATALESTVAQAMKLETGLAEISTLFDGTAEDTKRLNNEILTLQRRFGSSQADLAKGYYEAISSGVVDAATATTLMQTAQKLAVGGVTTLTTAINGLTNIMGAYGYEARDAAAISDILFIGMRDGKTNITNLATDLGRVTSIAAKTGVSIQEVVASVSALTTGGLTTSESVTQLRAVITALSRQSEPLKRVLREVGITSIQTAVAQDGLGKTLERVIAATNGSQEAMFDLFGDQDAVAGIAALTGKAIQERMVGMLLKMGEAARTNGQVTETAMNKMANTSGFTLGKIKGELGALATTMGQDVSQAFAGLGDSTLNAIQTLARNYGALAAALKSVDWRALGSDILAFGTMAAAGFALWNVSAIGTSIVAFAKSAAAMAKAIYILRTAILAFVAPAAIMIAKVLALAAVLAGVYLFFENFGTIMKTIGLSATWLALKIADLALSFVELTIKLDTFFGRSKMAAESMAKLAKERERLNGAQKENSDGFGKLEFSGGALASTWERVSKFVDTFKGKLEDATVAQDKLTAGAETRQLPKPPGASVQPTGRYETTEMMKRRLTLIAEMENRVADLRSQGQDQYVAQYEKAMREITEKERQAAFDGINISREAAGVKAELVKAYGRQAGEAAQALARTEREAQAFAFNEQARKLDEQLAAGLLKREEHNAAITALATKYGADVVRAEQEVVAKVAQIRGSQVGVLYAQTNTQIAEVRRLVNAKEISEAEGANLIRTINRRLQDDLNKMRTDAALSQARAAGDTTRAIRLEAENQIAEQKKAYEQGLIDFKEFEAAKAEIRRKEFQAKAQTTGSARTDERVGQATNMLAAAQSGLSSIVSSIGSMFGPIGMLIAQIVNMLGMAPEQFRQMVSSLLKAAFELPRNIVKNIPVLINMLIDSIPDALVSGIEAGFQYLPEAILNVLAVAIGRLPDFINQMLSVPFWTGIVRNLVRALTAAFKNFWGALFTGKRLDTEMNKGLKQQAAPKFGPGAESGGGGTEFKIKDLDLANRRTGQSVQDQIETTVEEGGKGFLDYIKQAWQWVIENVWEPIWGWVTAPFIFVRDEILMPLWEALKPIFEMGANGFRTVFDYANNNVFQPVLTAFRALWDFVAGIFTPIIAAIRAVFLFVKESIFDPIANLWDKPIKSFSDLWAAAKDIFRSPIDAFTRLFDSLKGIGSSILDGIKNGISNVWPVFTELGSKIFGGLKDLMDKFNPVNLLSKLFGDSSGKGTIEGWIGTNFPFLKFAGGGVVPGQASVMGDSEANDTVPALVSPGEAIIPRSLMRVKEIAKVVRGILSKRRVPQFSLGRVGAAIATGGASEVVRSDGAGKAAVDEVKAKFDSLSGAVKEAYNFLKNAGASIDLAKFVASPATEAKRAMKGIINSFTEDRIGGVVKGLIPKMANGGEVTNAMSNPTLARFLNGGAPVGTDTAPILATPGENINPRGGMRSDSQPVYNYSITVNVHPTADMSEQRIRQEVAPVIFRELERATRNGTGIVSPRGVR